MISVQFDNVSFEYSRNEPVIRDLSMTITAGEFVAVIGHNGSGKSTLAKLCNGILTPNSGKVTVFGMDTADEGLLDEIRKRAGMVFQNPDNQIVATSVEEDTAFAPENLGVAPAEIRRRVDESLARVGMSAYAHRQPHKLSGGQKQRVAIAGILAMQPSCIILDEPTAMLDPAGRREVMATVKDLNRSGITVLMITHYMDEAAQAGRVVVLDRGRIVADDSPRKIFSKTDMLRELGLGLPVSTELAQMLAAAGANITDTVLNPEECAEQIYRAAGGK